MKLWTKDVWLHLSKKDLRIEMDQCRDEGKDLAKVQAEFDALLADGQDEEDMIFQVRAGKLLDKTARLRPKRGHPYKEPSDLEGIRRARRGRVKLPQADLGDDAILDRVLGAWQGRSAGCLCGKTVEGRTRQQIQAYLEHQGRWPLSFYFSNKADEHVRKANNFREPSNRCYVENITCMVEDDDTNYTTTGLAVVERCGKDFTPADVGRFWMGNIPILHTCTAERVAYRNLVSLIGPPGPDGKLDGPFSSATYRNPYREWIGAQIRADFFGYVNPANPERAAECAWRDAAISHVKNGIYGEMWVAAMLAAAYAISDDVTRLIRAGMGEIPAKSRLHEDLSAVLDWRQGGIGYWEAVDRIHRRWDQMNGHH